MVAVKVGLLASAAAYGAAVTFLAVAVPIDDTLRRVSTMDPRPEPRTARHVPHRRRAARADQTAGDAGRRGPRQATRTVGSDSKYIWCTDGSSSDSRVISRSRPYRACRSR